jgi:hypothetical protein
MLQLKQVKKEYSATTVLSIDALTIENGIILLQVKMAAEKPRY